MTDRFRRLRSCLTGRSARVCVIGQGYVGLTLAASLAVEGMVVTGIDLDTERLDTLRAGRQVVPGVDDSLFALAYDTGRLSFSTGVEDVDRADVVVICVPTPVTEHRPDLSAVESAGAAVGQRLRRGSLVVLESTTYPGTTEQVLLPLLQSGGLRVGRDFRLAFSPERIDPGNLKYGLRNTPRIVGGVDAGSTESAALFYATVVDDVHTVSSPRSAELAKLLENTFRMVNIALVNELAVLCSKQGIDTWEVIEAAATKPFGFMAFQPGPGVGGHCIPLDPTYLAWQSRRDTGHRFRLVEMAQDINAEMPAHVSGRIIDALGQRGIPLRDATVLCLGVTYKPNVGDLRESAAVETIAQLARRGVSVRFHDPYVDRIDTHGLRLRRSALTTRAIAAADCVAVLTPHDDYEFDHVLEHARLVFDARNALKSRDPKVVAL